MFYIGQKVVRIAQHMNNTFIKGCVYTIKSIGLCSCGCGKEVINLGVLSHRHLMQCGYSKKHKANDGFYGTKKFRPLLTDSIEYAEKLLEEITIEINEENLVTK